MEADNIVAINIPNIVSITLMAVVGGLILGLIGKAVKGANANSAGSGSQVFGS
jgi:hypothetical protein